MSKSSERIQEAILEFIAGAPQGRSAIEIVSGVAEREEIRPDVVRRELMNLMERGHVSLKSNLKLKRSQAERAVDHTTP